MSHPELILSCEHGGNDIPQRWRSRWIGQEAWLKGHRGLDHGALDLTHDLARAFGVGYHAVVVTRLLIDMNRDSDGKSLFIEEAFELDDNDRKDLIEGYWRPHREAVRAAIRSALTEVGEAQLLSVHTFTPIWKGREREVDLGLLIDPKRARDLELAEKLMREIAALEPGLRLAINEPYSGLEEGIDASLREEFSNAPVGVMTLEVNQRFPLELARDWQRLKRSLERAMLAALRS